MQCNYFYYRIWQGAQRADIDDRVRDRVRRPRVRAGDLEAELAPVAVQLEDAHVLEGPREALARDHEHLAKQVFPIDYVLDLELVT